MASTHETGAAKSVWTRPLIRGLAEAESASAGATGPVADGGTVDQAVPFST